MAERVVIKIEANADNRQIDQTTRKLQKLAATDAMFQKKSLSSALKTNNGYQELLGDRTNYYKEHFDGLDKMVKESGKMLNKGLGLASKAAAAEMGLLSASMLAVHGAFIIGNVAMKAYRGGLQLLSGGAIAAGAALGAVAAAMEEQTAAMYAFRYGTSELGSNLQTATASMRSLTQDSDLAAVGVKNLQKAFDAVSKTSRFDAGSQKMLKSLMDFASAGQPIEQGIQKAGELIAILQKNKTRWSEARTAALSLFPDKRAMQSALRQLHITTKEGLKKAITSGELAKVAGVQGQFDTISGTLINTLKGYFNSVKSQFTALGDPFLKPLKKGAQEIFLIFQRGFRTLSGAMSGFGATTLADSLVSAADKLERFMTRTILLYLPRTQGMLSKIGDWWSKFKDGFKAIANMLRPLIDGAKVIEKAFGKMFKPIADQISGQFGSFNTFLQENKQTVLDFGSRIGELIASFMKMTSVISKLWQDLLPFINKVISGATMLINTFTSVLKLVDSIASKFGGKGMGALFTLLAARNVGKAMSGTKGGFLGMTKMTPGLGGASLPGVANTGGPGGIYGSSMAALNQATGGLSSAGSSLSGSANGLRSAATMLMQAAGGPAGGGGPTGPMQGPPSPNRTPVKNNSNVPTTYTGQRSSLSPRGRAWGSYMGSKKGWSMGKDAIGARMSNWAATQFSKITPDEYAAMQAQKRSSPGAIGRTMSGMRNARERFSATKAGKALNGPMAGMGATLGLGLLSSKVDKSAQGSFALGSAVSSESPLLGAAIAGLGGAMNSRTAAGGALLGAGGGAALGMQVAGPAGAAVGAVLGGISGAIMGWRNKSKIAKKKAREAVTTSMNEMIYGAVNEAALSMKPGTKGASVISKAFDTITNKFSDLNSYIESLKAGGMGSKDILNNVYNNQGKYGIDISKSQLGDMKNAADTSLSAFGQQNSDNALVSGHLNAAYMEKLAVLKEATGKSEQELVDLARSMNVNLVDSSMDAADAIKALGMATMQTSDQWRAQASDDYAKAFGIFDKRKAFDAASASLDKRGRGLAEAKAAGGLGESDIRDYLQGAGTDLMALYGGDATKASTAYTSLYGNKDSKFYTDKKSYGYGLYDQFHAGGVGKDQTAVEKMLTENSSTQITDQITKFLAGKDMKVGDATGLKSQILAMTPEQRMALSTQASGGFAGVTDFSNGFTGLTGLTTSALGANGKGQIDMTGIDKELAAKYQTFITDVGAMFQSNLAETPEWFKADAMRNLFKEAGIIKDTMTPRGSQIGDTTTSRLSQTMARHSSLNGQLTGKRTMTSAYRTTGLGSINSDHVTGRAYDLTGQNLGQYGTLVNNTGGFAEFHGIGGERHLHVVPGPGAMGDTASPNTSVGVMRSSGGGSTNYYQFTISGGNTDAETIANRVMQKINSIQRSKNERS